MKIHCPTCGEPFEFTLEVDSMDHHPALIRVYWERTEIVHKCANYVIGGQG